MSVLDIICGLLTKSETLIEKFYHICSFHDLNVLCWKHHHVEISTVCGFDDENTDAVVTSDIVHSKSGGSSHNNDCIFLQFNSGKLLCLCVEIANKNFKL